MILVRKLDLMLVDDGGFDFDDVTGETRLDLFGCDIGDAGPDKS